MSPGAQKAEVQIVTEAPGRLLKSFISTSPRPINTTASGLVAGQYLMVNANAVAAGNKRRSFHVDTEYSPMGTTVGLKAGTFMKDAYSPMGSSTGLKVGAFLNGSADESLILSSTQVTPNSHSHTHSNFNTSTLKDLIEYLDQCEVV